MDNDVTWVASMISCAAGALGAEILEFTNWLVFFRCVLEEIRVVIARLAYWMASSSTPLAVYCALMVCRLVALDKRPGVRPMGIR